MCLFTASPPPFSGGGFVISFFFLSDSLPISLEALPFFISPIGFSVVGFWIFFSFSGAFFPQTAYVVTFFPLSLSSAPPFHVSPPVFFFFVKASTFLVVFFPTVSRVQVPPPPINSP